MITASRSLFTALVPLTGNYDFADRELTTTVKVKEEEHSPAVSSNDASAESDAEESDDMEIKRMSLGPSGGALLRDHHEHTAPTTRAMGSTTKQVPAMDKSDQMQIYVAKFMEKFLQDQHLRPPRTVPTGRPTSNHNVFGACMPDNRHGIS